MATIKDVARVAGVSVATVSRARNGKFGACYLAGDNAILCLPRDISGEARTLKLSMRYAF